MPWAWLGLWRYWLRFALMPVVLLFCPVFIFLTVKLPWLCVALGLLSLWSGVIFYTRERWLLRFARACRRFAAVSRCGITVYYDPQATTGLDAALLLILCRREKDLLARRFGFPLRGRLRVYAFSDPAPIGRIFRPGYWGTALFEANAIVITTHEHDQELIRHELTHLFACRWSRLAPPLVSEGLAVWLQRTRGGYPVDAQARHLGHRQRPLTRLLKWQDFFNLEFRHESYTLAGSFTGHLIRRFGWDAFRRFYRRVTDRNFRSRFRVVFGRDYDEVEREWRDELARGRGAT
jgi:hypothetical protein